MLDKVKPGGKGCTFAYISETSWPSKESVPHDAIEKRAKQIIEAQPEILVTTQELYDKTKQFCSNTTFIVDPFPYIKFCELYGRYHSEPTAKEEKGYWIYDNCKVGEGTIIEPGTVIGGSSVGCDLIDGKLIRRKQFGGVKIGKNCYISPNCSIERGAFEDTIIGDNCFIDSGVKISHNCIIGDNVVILGNSTLAGHSNLANLVYIACNCYVHRGVTVGERTIIGAGSVIRKDLSENLVVAGNPPRIIG